MHSSGVHVDHPMYVHTLRVTIERAPGHPVGITNGQALTYAQA